MTPSTTNTLLDLYHITTDYEYLSEQETDIVLHHIEEHINTVKTTPTQNQWNDAWDEISKCDAPKYFKPRLTLDNKGIYRYKQQYIKSAYQNLEGEFHNELLNRVQDKWLSDVDCVVEFGCGTGHNLQKIRNKNPNIKVYGSDWAGSSQKILEKNNIPSWNFDMKKSDGKLPREIFEHDSICFLTVGSLEQLGTEWSNFTNFMFNFRPYKSIHIEPIIELYSSSNIVDQMAIKYHKKRNYLNGFFKYLLGTDELKFYERTTFGNTYNEGFTVLELEYV